MEILYKPGQGVWARGVSAVSLVALGIYAAVQTRGWLVDYGIWQNVVSAALFVVFAGLGLYLSNIAKPAELLIETEIEMRKVTWPSAGEVFGATAVVIVVTLILGFYLYALDIVMSYSVLRWLGVSPF